QQRDGWSHKNVLQIAHPKPLNEDQDKLFAYVVGKREELPEITDLCIGIRKMKEVEKAKDAAELVLQYRLPREVVPTEFLNSIEVWEALLQSMPITACIRNLGKMSSLEMLGAQSEATKTVLGYLRDENRIRNGRVHPLAIMNALMTYKAGKGVKGSLIWKPTPKISEALDDAFYTSFKYVEPSGKRIMVALDVSGSMTSYKLSGSHMDCRTAAAVLAMVTMRTEKDHMIVGFTGNAMNTVNFGGGGYYGSYVSELDISPRQMLGDVVRYVDRLGFGATDCAAPMSYAIKRKLDIDTFVVYTDNETWAGRIHPFQELENYRRRSGIPAKLIVVGMVGNKVSIANPDDPGMLDVVGFDTNTPNAISEFSRM
ncbi:MAG: TROVE domain-containing protein, partial [bacterium]